MIVLVLVVFGVMLLILRKEIKKRIGDFLIGVYYVIDVF